MQMREAQPPEWAERALELRRGGELVAFIALTRMTLLSRALYVGLKPGPGLDQTAARELKRALDNARGWLRLKAQPKDARAARFMRFLGFRRKPGHEMMEWG